MMRIVSAGHAVFAAMMIAIGLQGMILQDFTIVWAPVPDGVPARAILVYFCALVSVGCGIGLLWQRTARIAAGVLLASLLFWLLLWRVRALFIASLIEGTWSFGETLVFIGAAWVLFAAFSKNGDPQHLRFATGDKGMRIARVLYGIGLIPFGYAHFANVSGTAVLVPGWLPWHVGWAYFTGATFIAAGLGMITGVYARLAAALSALQIGLFSLLVWIPLALSRSLNAFQWGELETTFALTAVGWVVADSYRNTPWLAVRNR